MRGKTMPQVFRNIDHILALSRIIAQNEPHKPADVERCMQEWLSALRAEMKECNDEISLQNLAAIYLLDLLQGSPVGEEKLQVKICPN